MQTTTQVQLNHLTAEVFKLKNMLSDIPVQTAALIVAIRDGHSLEEIAGYRDEAVKDLCTLGKREEIPNAGN